VDFALRPMHRVITHQQNPFSSGLTGKAKPELLIQYRLTRAQYPMKEGLDLGGIAAQRLLQGPPQVRCGWQAVHRRERVVDAYEPKVTVDEGQAHRRTGEHRVEQGESLVFRLQRRLGVTKESSIVHRHCGSPGEVSGQQKVGPAVLPPGL